MKRGETLKNIIVCMKQVLDPEIPLSLFHIDTEAKQAVQPKAMPPVLSPFDENALEAALKIKDSQETNVIVISLGKKLNKVVVSSALAAGADQLILLQDEAFSEFNTHLTANAISAAIKKLGQYDLILCGLQAADTNTGQVGIGIAGILGIPCITSARNIELAADKVIVEKVSDDSSEILEVSTPAVVTTTYEVGVLREPGVEAFMSAANKPITTWNAQELGIEIENTNRFTMIKMVEPARESKCEILEGSSPEEKAEKLVTRLTEVKVI
jgi:electron transfer flavoprotein beta subunit